MNGKRKKSLFYDEDGNFIPPKRTPEEQAEADREMEEKEKFFEEHPELIPDYLHKDNDD